MLKDNYIAHLVYEMDVAADAHPSNYEEFVKYSNILSDYVETMGVVEIDKQYLEKYCEIENQKRNSMYHLNIHWEDVKIRKKVLYTVDDIRNRTDR